MKGRSPEEVISVHPGRAGALDSSSHPPSGGSVSASALFSSHRF